MAVQILDDYPPGTARGNTCYACGAGRRELRDADGTLRSERVVDFMQLIDFEGHMMLCEQCVAEAARFLGLVDGAVASQWLDEGRAQVAEAEAARDGAIASRDAAISEAESARAAVAVFAEFVKNDAPPPTPKPRAKAKASA